MNDNAPKRVGLADLDQFFGGDDELPDWEPGADANVRDVDVSNSPGIEPEPDYDEQLEPFSTETGGDGLGLVSNAEWEEILNSFSPDMDGSPDSDWTP